MNNLQTIQGAAKLEHLPENPERLIINGVGQELDANKPALINKANEERPGGLDTSFIEETRVKRTAYVNKDGEKGSQVPKGKQARVSREALPRGSAGCAARFNARRMCSGRITRSRACRRVMISSCR